MWVVVLIVWLVILAAAIKGGWFHAAYSDFQAATPFYKSLIFGGLLIMTSALLLLTLWALTALKG